MKQISFTTFLPALLLATLASTPLQARDRPGTPNEGVVGLCSDPIREAPALCVQFRNTASEDVGFWMEWTENGAPMSSDLRGRSACITRSAQAYSCFALQGWFGDQSRRTQYRSIRNLPEGFIVKSLGWDTEYCFRFRAVDDDGVISGDWSGFACLRTPLAPAVPPVVEPPKVTAIQPTTGVGVVGGPTPFKLLVEWAPPPGKDWRTTGWYSVEYLKSGRWMPLGKVMPQDSGMETVLDSPALESPEKRQAVRVCSVNVSGQNCSRESWYHGQLSLGEKLSNAPVRAVPIPKPATSTIEARKKLPVTPN